MPIIHAEILAGRPPEKIRELHENLANTLVQTLGVAKESVRVIVTEIPKTHWSVAGIPMSEK